MKTALIKNFTREIKNSFARFLSIALIVALGVAFFAGIRATSPDMILTADSYFDASNLMDIKVLGTWGLEQEDMELLSKLPQVKELEGAYSMDLFGSIDESQYILKTMSLPQNINKLQIVEGRLPESEHECVIDKRLLFYDSFKIGNKISFTAEEEHKVSDYLTQDSYTIVGIVTTSYFLSTEQDSTSIGNGSIDGYVMVPSENFTLEAFTEAYITINNALKLTSSMDNYDNLISSALEKIEVSMDRRADSRYKTVIEEANIELSDAKDEIKTAKKDLVDGQKTLANKKIEISDGKKEIAISEKEFEDARTEAETKLNNAKKELDSAKKELAAAKELTKKGWIEIKKAKKELVTSGTALTSAYKKLNDTVDSIVAEQVEPHKESLNDAEYKSLVKSTKDQVLKSMSTQFSELDKKQKELDSAHLTISKKEASLKTADLELASKEIELDRGFESYNKEKQNAETSLQEGASKIASAKAKIKEGELKLLDAEQELLEGIQEVEDGEKELADKESELADLEKPVYYTLDRNSLPGYVGYQQDADRINAIGQVFPLLFFLVAALVSLTTMTRMVEADRTQIGTLKALGYSKLQIARKYILYALIATLAGSLIGMIVGQKVLPAIIIDAYSMLYTNLPPTETPLNAGYSIVSTGLAVFTTLLATIIACYKELLATPSTLMRPVSPKNGKRVFLEYIPFIWKRLNFTKKVTARNLIRYKKRFLMTVFGIGSCMALLLVGFGLQNSIFSIVSDQYDKVFTYNASIMMNDKASEEERKTIQSYIADNSSIKNSIDARMLNIDATVGEVTKSAYIFSVDDTKELDQFISLQNRVSGQRYTLSNHGVIITEKLASLLKVTKGDTLQLDKDGHKVNIVIDQVTENHIAHYVYMTKSLYEQLFNTDFIANTTLFLFNDNWNDQMGTSFSEDFLSIEGIESITLSATDRSKAADMIDGMDIIILVLIISAGALAFVVLYNLNNINITERKRELATIKVLGFYDGEVAGYVYRENILLTFIGTVIGIIMGVFLHRFVIITAELDMIMFGRKIFFDSYLYSFLLTLGFSAFVNLILYFKLKSIDMIESLKSVE